LTLRNTATALIAAMSFGPALAIAGALTPHKAEYVLERNDRTVAGGAYELDKTENGTFVYHSEAHPRGFLANLFAGDQSLTERSRFRVEGEDDRLVPLQYRFVHDKGDKKKIESVDFHWDQGVAEAVDKGETAELELTEGVIDRMILPLAIRRDLSRGSARFTYQLVDSNKLKTYEFEIAERERVETPAGTFHTLKVVRTDDPDKEVVFWCAPTLDYLQVKFVRREKGDPTLELKLESVTGLPADDS